GGFRRLPRLSVRPCQASPGDGGRELSRGRAFGPHHHARRRAYTELSSVLRRSGRSEKAREIAPRLRSDRPPFRFWGSVGPSRPLLSRFERATRLRASVRFAVGHGFYRRGRSDEGRTVRAARGVWSFDSNDGGHSSPRLRYGASGGTRSSLRTIR